MTPGWGASWCLPWLQAEPSEPALRGQARVWSLYSFACCPQPGLGPQRFGLTGIGKYKPQRDLHALRSKS